MVVAFHWVRGRVYIVQRVCQPCMLSKKRSGTLGLGLVSMVEKRTIIVKHTPHSQVFYIYIRTKRCPYAKTPVTDSSNRTIFGIDTTYCSGPWLCGNRGLPVTRGDGVRGPSVRRWCDIAIRPPYRGNPPYSFQVMSAIPQ